MIYFTKTRDEKNKKTSYNVQKCYSCFLAWRKYWKEKREERSKGKCIFFLQDGLNN